MSRRHKLGDFIFNLDEIKLESAPELGRKALERVNFTNGRVELHKISRHERTFGREDLLTTWQVSCSQGRKRATDYYDLAGNESK